VKVNAILIPGVNDEHLVEVAAEVARLGAARLNCLPLHPVPTTPFGRRQAPTAAQIHQVRAACARYLPQMRHCSRCRADAVGRIGHWPSQQQLRLLGKHGTDRPEPRPYVAVLSHEGVLVNQRVGEASRVLVFGRRGDGFGLVEERETPPTGGGRARWRELGRALGDCQALLTSGAGASPQNALAATGLEVVETEGLIEDALDAVYQKRPLPRPRPERFRCGRGTSCGGNGTACG